jgi:hypothetical protein
MKREMLILQTDSALHRSAATPKLDLGNKSQTRSCQRAANCYHGRMSAKASRRLRNALVVVLVLAALYTAYRYTLHRMVEAKLDEIRKQGYPVTLAELDKWYRCCALNRALSDRQRRIARFARCACS